MTPNQCGSLRGLALAFLRSLPNMSFSRGTGAFCPSTLSHSSRHFPAMQHEPYWLLCALSQYPSTLEPAVAVQSAACAFWVVCRPRAVLGSSTFSADILTRHQYALLPEAAQKMQGLSQ